MKYFLIFLFSLSALAFSPAKKESFQRSWVPEPIFDKEPAYVDLYWTAWKQAYDHVDIKEGIPQSPYMDEAFASSHVWIWDTCFMVLFCKYSPEKFPGVETLNNFYEAFHTDKYKSGNFPLGIQHPDNPPLFAWAEYGNYLFTGDDQHAETLLTDTQYLQKHFNWFHDLEKGWRFKYKGGESAPVSKDNTPLGYKWGGCPSGMDNTPRAPHGLWLDALAQQGLSALAIYRMAERIGKDEMAAKWKNKYEEIKKLVNTHYWDEKDGIYYDISEDGKKFYKIKTPASYWPMLAEMCSPEQAKRMAEHISDPKIFGGMRPWVTVSRSDKNFVSPDGAYWRGGIWLPTAYMGTKALEKYGFHKEANKAAENLIAHMARTYDTVEPKTIWECYSPTRDYPVVRQNGHIVRKDFCGWSALGPISMFIENVLGFHTVDAKNKRLEWNLHQQSRHGIKNFKFGEIATDIIYNGKDKISISTNQAYTLVINGKEFPIKAGQSNLTFKAPKETEFKLEVQNADASGSYTEAKLIKLQAPATKGDKQFYNWTISDGEIDDAQNPNTLFYMPSIDVVVKANYRKVHAVKFIIPSGLEHLGDGSLNQNVTDGKNAQEPLIRAKYGWAFDGWDKSLNNITNELTIRAIASPSSDLIDNGDFSKGVKYSAKWNEFKAKSSKAKTWYIPLFDDRFKLNKENHSVINNHLNSDKASAMYQSLESPPAGNYTFSFDYMSKDVEQTQKNQFSWAILAYFKDSKDDQLGYGNSFSSVEELPVSAKKLASSSFAPGTCSWKTLTDQKIAVPANVERLVIALGVSQIKSSKGDKFAISNVQLKLDKSSN